MHRLDATHGWMPDLDHLKSLVTPATRARDHRSQQPDRRGLLRPRRAAHASTSPSSTGLPILADEVYGDLGFDGPVGRYWQASIRTRRSSRSPSLSKAYLAPGWRTGWMACRPARPRLDDVRARR